MGDLNDPKSSGSTKSKKSHSGNECGCLRCFRRLCSCLRASPSPDALRKNLSTPGAGQKLSCDVAVQVEDLDFYLLLLEDSDDEEQVESLSDSLTYNTPQPSNAVVVRARDSPTFIPDQAYGPWFERVGQGENHRFYYEGFQPKDKRPRTAPTKRGEGGEVSVKGDKRNRPSTAL